MAYINSEKVLFSANVNITEGGSEANLQEKTATPTYLTQTITPDAGYDGLSKVTINAVDSSIDANITAENIKKDVTILGVTGTHEGGGTVVDINGYYWCEEESVCLFICDDFVYETYYGFSDSFTFENNTLAWDDNYTYTYDQNAKTFYSEEDDLTYVKQDDVSEEIARQGVMGEYNANDSSGYYVHIAEDKITFAIGFTTEGLYERSYNKYKIYQDCVVAFSVTDALTSPVKIFKFSIENGDLIIVDDGDKYYQTVSGTNKLAQVVDNSVTTLSANDLKGATKIKALMFQNGVYLTDIVIPNSVTSIEIKAFSTCGNLTTVYFESGSQLSEIGERAFISCSSLPTIELPESVTSIGLYAFASCTSLTHMTIKATTPPSLSSTDSISSATTKIYIPVGTLEAYSSATNWSSFADKFEELEV